MKNFSQISVLVQNLLHDIINKKNQYIDNAEIVEAQVRINLHGKASTKKFHVRNIELKNSYDIPETTSDIVSTFNDAIGDDYTVFYAGKALGTLIYSNKDESKNTLVGMLLSQYNNDHFQFIILGSDELCEITYSHMDKKYKVCHPCILNRVFYNKSYGEFTTIPLIVDDANEHVSGNYPYIEEDAKELWNKFKESSSNMMMFIGPPGTGKSHLIKNIASEHGWDKEDVYLIDSKQALDKEELINFFYEIKPGSLVAIEDADTFVKKREHGNEQMSGILNVLAGVSGMNIKFIVSTNLPSLKDVDTAFIRPGRCFRTIEFKKLKGEEINNVRIANNLPVLNDIGSETTMTLAQVLNFEEDNGTQHLVSNKML